MESNKCKCLKCGAEWIKRIDNPIQCPRCKSMLWNKEKKEVKTNETRT